MKFKHYNSSGFTIIELMIAIAIAGIMAAIALPNFSAMIKNNCMTTNANQLVSSLQLARSEAVKRRSIAGVTVSASSATAGNQWGTGWTVTEGADTIRVIELTCGLGTMTFAGTRSDITYDSSGYTTQTATFTLCDDRTGETGRQITVNALGRPSTDNEHSCS